MIALLISLWLKNGEGVGEAQCFIKMGKNKERNYVGLKIKLSERRVHCVYLNLYKSKYSTINIQFSHPNFKNVHPHVQNNVRNCVQHKQKNKQTNKGGMGEKCNGLLTHFICSVNMIVCLPGCVWPWVQIWVQCHGYGYESGMSRSHWYGFETISMGTGTNFVSG